MTYQEFVATPESQRRYWARAHVGWSRMGTAEPNDGHRALARLEAAGRVSFLITQNVDGLHERAGHRQMVALHGRISDVVCLDCGGRTTGAPCSGCSPRPTPAGSQQHSLAGDRPDGDVDLEETRGSSYPPATGAAAG